MGVTESTLLSYLLYVHGCSEQIILGDSASLFIQQLLECDIVFAQLTAQGP